MDLNPYPSVYHLLKTYNIRPKKGLGQNFLADSNHLAKIVTSAGLSEQDVVLEVGPGLGALSIMLAQVVKEVVAVEIDADMVDVLKREMARYTNFNVVQADILTVDPVSLLAAHLPGFSVGDPYHVVANLPYYITSAIIRHLLAGSHPPQTMVVTLQKEVAERIVAKPGAMSLLAVSVQFYGKPTLCHIIPANAFVPPPKVTSAVLRIDRYEQSPLDVTDPKVFFQVVKAGFSQKRKQLKNALSGGLHRPQAELIPLLKAAQIDPTRRAETLSLPEWARLTAQLYDA